jgi:hypothetical protein
MHLDFRPLPDAIQPPDALLQQFRIERQIEHDEVVRKLKVAPLATDLRTEQDARTVLLRKPRGVAIALHQRQPFVKHRLLYVQALAQCRINRLHLSLRATNEQHLRRIKRSQ